MSVPGPYHHRRARKLATKPPFLDMEVLLVQFSSDAKVTGISEGKVVFHKTQAVIEEWESDCNLEVEGS